MGSGDRPPGRTSQKCRYRAPSRDVHRASSHHRHALPPGTRAPASPTPQEPPSLAAIAGVTLPPAGRARRPTARTPGSRRTARSRKPRRRKAPVVAKPGPGPGPARARGGAGAAGVAGGVEAGAGWGGSGCPGRPPPSRSRRSVRAGFCCPVAAAVAPTSPHLGRPASRSGGGVLPVALPVARPRPGRPVRRAAAGRWKGPAAPARPRRASRRRGRGAGRRRRAAPAASPPRAS